MPCGAHGLRSQCAAGPPFGSLDGAFPFPFAFPPMKILATAALLAAGIVGAARADLVLSSCDFGSYAPGLLTSSANGLTAGQGGWFAYTSSTTSPTANFNIVGDPAAGGTHGSCLAVTGGTTQIGNNGDRSAWTNDVHDNIGLRAPGEDLIVATFDMYVGGQATSKNRVGAVIQDSTATKILSGLYMQANTRQLYIASYSTSGSTTANNVTSLGSGAVLQLNTWYTFSISFDIASGRSQVGFLNAATGSWSYWSVDGAAAGTVPDRFTLQSLVNTSSNTSAGYAVGYYDNIGVVAVPAPGAVALFGMAGLAARARRRRA